MAVSFERGGVRVKTKGMRRKRAAAFFIDCATVYLLSALCGYLLLPPLLQFGTVAIALGALFAAAIVVGIFLRDYLFHGPGLGKRLLKLRTVDARSGDEPSLKQTIVKNFFIFLFPLDGLVLLLTGRSLGERLSDTRVIAEPSSDKQPLFDATAKKRVRTAGVTVLCITAGFLGIIYTALGAVKTQEPYPSAYAYLTDSDIYKEGSSVLLTGYALWNNDIDYTFLVDGKAYHVICHREGDGWIVCRDCTAF